MEDIFRIFSHRNSDGNRGGGLGIGLALVRDLATLHGGSVHVHSAGLGHGSEFTLRLRTPPAA